MEQATTGKAPQSIAINTGGGLQILNMNAVRAAAVGATVVPTPGSAQTATVVGSSGPQGKAVGPRMISLSSPQMQMLANRPGQPVDESDSEGVKANVGRNTSTAQSYSPAASITGASSDLLADSDYDNDVEEGDLMDVKDSDDKGLLNASGIRVEGNHRNNVIVNHESAQVDENDLCLSPIERTVTVLGSPPASDERSDQSTPHRESHTFYPNSGDDSYFQFDQESVDCDENENHECKYVPPSPSDSDDKDNHSDQASTPEISSCKKQVVEYSSSIIGNESLGAHPSAQNIGRIEGCSDRNNLNEDSKESDFCFTETIVPVPVRDFKVACQKESLPSGLIVANVKQSQKSVQNQNPMDSCKQSTDNCDITENSVVRTVSALVNDQCSGAFTMKLNSEPPPLVHEGESKGDTSGSDILARRVSSSSVDPVEIVDDVNLDMFSDNSEPNKGAGQLGKNTAISVSVSAGISPEGDKSNDKKPRDSDDENRPKLMDMNLADFIFMDCDDEGIESRSWNHRPVAEPTHAGDVEQPFFPKVAETPQTQQIITQVSPESTLTSLSAPNNTSGGNGSRNNSRSISDHSEQAPCAFQMYTVGQGQPVNNQPRQPVPVSNQSQLTPRNSMRNDHQINPSSPLRQSQQPQIYGSLNSTGNCAMISAPDPNPGATMPFPTHTNNTSTETEYKGNIQGYFTTDPQLHSQFIQFNKYFPLPEPVASLSKPDGIGLVRPPVTLAGQFSTQKSQIPSKSPQSQSRSGAGIPSQSHQPSPHAPKTFVVQSQRQPYPPSAQAYPPQSLPFQSPAILRSTTNGCESIRPAYNMQQVSSSEHSSAYTQSSPVVAAVRQLGTTGGSYYNAAINVSSHSTPTTQPQGHLLQNELSPCSYSTVQHTGLPVQAPGYSHARFRQPNYPGGVRPSTGSVYPGNYPGYDPSRNYSQHSLNPSRPTVPAFITQPSTSSAQHGPLPPYHKEPAGTSGAWNSSTTFSHMSAPTSRSTVSASGSSVSQSTVPYPTQNLGIQQAPGQRLQHHQGLPYSQSSSVDGARQYQPVRPGYSIEGRLPAPLAPSQRPASVISQYQSAAASPVRVQGSYPSSSGMDGGNQWNQAIAIHRGQLRPTAISQSSSATPSPQMLRNPHYIAQFRNPSVRDSHLSNSSSIQNQSVIRPTVYSGNSLAPIRSNCNTSIHVRAPSSSISNANNSRPQVYRNQYPNYYSSTASSQPHHYYSNQASVIRVPQNSINSNHSNSQGSNASCAIRDKGGSLSGYHSGSSSGYTGGELTLQSFLSNPSAPFMCPPSSSSPQSERSSSGSGKSKEVMGWGGERPFREGGDASEEYPLSSCQYSDAMRRYNAPITLQASLPGLPPGANHLLVKTENGQFQLVSVRMPAPTAAGPGTPVPSTAAPPTSMSIAQQILSNSSLAPTLPPHSVPSGGPHPPPSSVITTSTIPPHPSQQGRLNASSSSNHIVTSWSSTPNNSVVNNSTISSPLPVSSSAPIPHPPPRLAPPPLPTSSLPPMSSPSSVIMPPNLSASNSQLLTATGPSGSVTFSNPAAAAEFAYNHLQQQQRAPPHSVVVSSGGGSGGHPLSSPGVGLSSLPNSLSNMSPAPPNSISGSIIRTGGLATSSLPPPPPPVVVKTTMSSVSSSTPTGAVSTPCMNLLSTPPSSAIFRSQPTSQIPNNSTNNAVNQSSVGMMTASNSMSIQPHQIHPQYLSHPQAQAPSNTSITIASNTANTVSQMTNETAKNKCKNFLSFLLELSAKQNQTVARNVKNLIQGLIDGKVNEENFSDRLQREVNSQPQPCLVGFLKKSLPHLRHSLATNELKIEGIKPPPLSTFVPPAPITALVPQTPPPPTERKPSKGSSSKSKSNSSSNSSASGASSVSSGPGTTPSSKSSIPATSKSSKDKDRKDKTFSSSGYNADDDINDVAAMGGVNLAEESQRILGSTEFVGTQIRSCRDETLIPSSPIIAKFKLIAAKYGLDETPMPEVSALLSHAVEERLKTMVEKLSVITEHRMDVIKMDERYEVTQDVKGQLRFLEELDKIEKKRHDEQEREILIRAAKSRSKSEDPEQAKLKAKAKEMQRVQLEEMRQRDANFTALQAIGPRKKPKLDTPGGSHGSAMPSLLGASGASGSLGRTQRFANCRFPIIPNDVIQRCR